MKYVGSKNRLSKYIVPILQKAIDLYDPAAYIEPFVGGANIIDKIECKYNKFGCDNNKYLIAMWKALQNGWKPPETITEEEYYKVRDNKDEFQDHMVGLVGFCATYGAKWFGGYARGYKNDGVTPRDIPNEGIRNILKQLPNIMDVQFCHSDYTEHHCYLCVVYCDPPYKDTNYYKGDFDHEKFYDWCRDTGERNLVFVSEYWMPEDFVCIWEKKHKTSLDTDKHYNRVERLFIPQKNFEQHSDIFKEIIK